MDDADRRLETSEPQTLAARLEAARSRSFVGRTSELDLFRSALADGSPPFAVLFLHGPGGVGKTALLRRFEEVAGRERSGPVVLVDGKTIEPTPEGFVSQVARGLDVPEADVPHALHRRDLPVLLIDTYEQLEAIDGWLRSSWLPGLPAGSVVAIAGRNPPSPGWRADPGWHELLRVVALRDLPPGDAATLLSARGVAEERHEEVLRFARGHPLALVLIGDVLAQGGEDPRFAPQESPDVIEHLLGRFVRDVPGDEHRDALAVAAHTGVVTQTLLRDTVQDAAARELFEWLRTLSFAEEVPGGLALHDLVREILDADLRWRDPDRYTDLHRRVGAHLRRRVAETSGREQERAMLDTLQLYRFSPVGRTFFAWDALGDSWLEPASPGDHDDILAITREHEGEASAEIASYWLQRQPQAFRVFRTSGSDGPAGFIAHLLVGDAPGEETSVDPLTEAAWEHVRGSGPLRADETLSLLRFWVHRDSYQDVTTHHLVSTRAALDWLTTPGLAWSFVVLADPGFWEPIFALIDFHRPSTEAIAVGEQTYGMFARDWRVTSLAAWLDLLSERQLSSAETPRELPPRRQQLLVLSHPDFTDAVRDALRGYTRPATLEGNPLLRSRVVDDRAGDEPPVDVLRRLLEEVAVELSENPRDQKLLRALRLTYFEPAPTQEAAAERLDLPFSTFRRHLTAGVEHVAHRLWELELYGSDG